MKKKTDEKKITTKMIVKGNPLMAVRYHTMIHDSIEAWLKLFKDFRGDATT